MTAAVQSRVRPAIWRVHLLAALRVYLPLRILLSLWALVIVFLFPVALAPGTDVAQQVTDASSDDGFVADYLLEPWLRWDAGWYTQIARYGYSGAKPGATAFAPLYPVLTGLLARLLGERYLLAGLIVSNAAAIGAFALLHRLVTVAYSRRLADRTLIYLAVFPSSFYLLAPYTESLCLLLILGSFLAAQGERWALAGTLGALATLTRWPGVLVALALGWIFLQARRGKHPWQDWREWTIYTWRRWLPALWLGLIPLALLGISAYFRFGINQPPAWNQIALTWKAMYIWPWHALARNTLAVAGAIDRLGSSMLTLTSNSLAVVLCAALLLAGRRRIGGALLLYGWSQILLPTSHLIGGNILNAMVRYILLAFPAFIILAMMTRKKPWLHRALVAASILLGLLYSAMYILWLWLA